MQLARFKAMVFAVNEGSNAAHSDRKGSMGNSCDDIDWSVTTWEGSRSATPRAYAHATRAPGRGGRDGGHCALLARDACAGRG
jgi:hypothetical protein